MGPGARLLFSAASDQPLHGSAGVHNSEGVFRRKPSLAIVSEDPPPGVLYSMLKIRRSSLQFSRYEFPSQGLRIVGGFRRNRGRISRSPDRAHEAAGAGFIHGDVTDSGLRAIEGVEVSIVLSTVHVATDARGRFQISPGDTARPAILLETSVAERAAVTTVEHWTRDGSSN
jgi:hypothetical protein